MPTIKTIYVILGPQASGKGTQAVKLAKKFNLTVISTGDTLRDFVKNSQTRSAKNIKKIMNQGELVPDSYLNSILTLYFKKIDLNRGIVFDGYPRTLEQQKNLEKIIQKFNLSYPYCIFIKLSTTSVVKRIAGRRICSNCKYIFHPPRSLKLKKCSQCGGVLIKRSDDEPKAIKKRLAIFKKETEPIIKYYKSKSRLISIDGEPSINKVFKNILKLLENHRRIHGLYQK